MTCRRDGRLRSVGGAFVADALDRHGYVVELTECVELLGAVAVEDDLVHAFDVADVLDLVDGHLDVCATAACWRDGGAIDHFPGVDEHLRRLS